LAFRFDPSNFGFSQGVARLDQTAFYKKFFSIEEAEDIPRWNSTIQLVQVLKASFGINSICRYKQ
jgi:hypothetical protein